MVSAQRLTGSPHAAFVLPPAPVSSGGSRESAFPLTLISQFGFSGFGIFEGAISLYTLNTTGEFANEDSSESRSSCPIEGSKVSANPLWPCAWEGARRKYILTAGLKSFPLPSLLFRYRRES